MSLTTVPDAAAHTFVLSPVLLVPNPAEVSSGASLSSPHPLVKAVLYSTSSLSAESTFLLPTFYTIYFPFKLRTFIFLSFCLACLHHLQNLLLVSLLHLYS